MKSVILIGGGASITEGIEKGLWEQIKDQTVWSINFAFMVMPYIPAREIWVDRSFFKNNMTALNELANKDVEMVAKEDNLNKGLLKITTYPVTRAPIEYYGKEGIKKHKIYYGEQGFCGTFALHLAICEGYDIIYLLGFDFGVPTEKIKNNFTHFYQNKLNIVSSGVSRPEVYLKYNKIHEGVKNYDIFTQEKDVKIWNVSIDSNINSFDKISWEEFFKCLNG